MCAIFFSSIKIPWQAAGVVCTHNYPDLQNSNFAGCTQTPHWTGRLRQWHSIASTYSLHREPPLTRWPCAICLFPCILLAEPGHVPVLCDRPASCPAILCWAWRMEDQLEGFFPPPGPGMSLPDPSLPSPWVRFSICSLRRGWWRAHAQWLPAAGPNDVTSAHTDLLTTGGAIIQKHAVSWCSIWLLFTTATSLSEAAVCEGFFASR